MLKTVAKRMGGSASRRRMASTSSSSKKRVVIVDGTRTPFMMASTAYNDYMAYDLAHFAIKGLLSKTALDPKLVDTVIMGSVIQEVKCPNVAREAALAAGIPNDVPCHTVTQACISANQAIANGTAMIQSGMADIVVAGGTETFSDVPIRFSKPMRKKFIASMKDKTPMKKLQRITNGLKMSHLAPEPPAIANFATGEVMGCSSDRLAAKFGVSRESMDKFALRSHQLAAKATQEGIFSSEITAIDGHTEDNGIKGDSSLEKLSSLRPAFVRPHGTHTAANSSFLTDGAAATLIMSEEKALELGFQPKAVIAHTMFVGVDPFEELLLGPAYAIAKLLKSANMTMNDIDVWEIHEAFAGQVLANLAALESDSFSKDNWGYTGKVGSVPDEKLNVHGGSLSIGHPFGATGSRLTLTAANRLIREDGKNAMIAACADSGLGVGMILERYE